MRHPYKSSARIREDLVRRAASQAKRHSRSEQWLRNREGIAEEVAGDTTQLRVVRARSVRESLIRDLVHAGGGNGGAVLFAATSIPGLEKDRPGLDPFFRRALAAVESAWPGSRPVIDGSDVLGPYRAYRVKESARAIKEEAIRIEETIPGGRLLDLDVYANGAAGLCPDGGVPVGDGVVRPVDRASLGLPPRPCLVCGRPAADCIRFRRHPADALMAAVDALLHRAD